MFININNKCDCGNPLPNNTTDRKCVWCKANEIKKQHREATIGNDKKGE